MALNAVSAGFADGRCVLLPLFFWVLLRSGFLSLTMTVLQDRRGFRAGHFRSDVQLLLVGGCRLGSAPWRLVESLGARWIAYLFGFHCCSRAFPDTSCHTEEVNPEWGGEVAGPSDWFDWRDVEVRSVKCSGLRSAQVRAPAGLCLGSIEVCLLQPDNDDAAGLR